MGTRPKCGVHAPLTEEGLGPRWRAINLNLSWPRKCGRIVGKCLHCNIDCCFTYITSAAQHSGALGAHRQKSISQVSPDSPRERRKRHSVSKLQAHNSILLDCRSLCRSRESAFLELVGDRPDSSRVAEGSEADDHAVGDIRQVRMVAERFSCVNVGDLYEPHRSNSRLASCSDHHHSPVDCLRLGLT